MQSEHCLKKFQALGWSLCFVECFEVKAYIPILFVKCIFLLGMALSQGFYEVFVPFPP